MEADDLLFMAKLAEQAERYDDMVSYMKTFIIMQKNSGINEEQRNLFSIAYKNVISRKRVAIRILEGGNTSESEKKELDQVKKGFQQQVKEELKKVCLEVVKLVEEHLLNDAKETDEKTCEAQVFYYKLIGDYYRYLCEAFDQKNDRIEYKEKAKENYEKANEKATDLKPTHPIRLGLALNFSVFHYEIENNKATACKLAKEAFDNAIGELDKMSDDNYKDSTLIMQLLRDNLTLWTTEADGDEED